MAAGKYSNSQILAAVLNRWASPIIDQVLQSSLMQLPFIANIENKVRASGWVSPQWSLTQEFAPMISGMSGYVIEPLLANCLGNVPDAAIPKIAHGIVDSAIANGGTVKMFEGHLTLDENDLKELKKLLSYNLPVKAAMDYEVITDLNCKK